MARRGLESLDPMSVADVDLVSEAVVPSLDIPELIWDSKTERAFVYLVGLDAPSRTPLPTENTS